jgi:hypothetical protein
MSRNSKGGIIIELAASRPELVIAPTRSIQRFDKLGGARTIRLRASNSVFTSQSFRTHILVRNFPYCYPIGADAPLRSAMANNYKPQPALTS